MTAAEQLLDAVLARRLDRLTLVTRGRVGSVRQGEIRSKRRGSSVEFADYRHYAEGDDPHRVDWGVYARSDQLFVRLFEEESLLTVHLILDCSRSMDWGEPNKLDYARRLAAALGYVALNSAARLSAWSIGSGSLEFGPAWGRAQIRSLVSYLIRVVPRQSGIPGSHAPQLDRALAAYRGRAAGLTVFVSDLLSPTWEPALAQLGRDGSEVVVLHLLCPQELRPDLGGDVRLVDRESGALVPVTLNADALRLYGERLARFRESVANVCTRHSMRYALVDTSAPLESTLFDQLRNRGVVR